MTFWETVERGEYVMIALAVILIIVICIWWVRGARLGKERKSYAPLMQRLRDLIMEGDVENARQLCDNSVNAGGRVLAVGIKLIGKPMADLTSAIQDMANLEKEKMSRGLVWLRAFAVISPLLGLGGTLVGVIDRLRDIGLMGELADISHLCQEIAPTIITTVAGLGVGIFSIIAFTCLDASIDGSRNRLSELTLEFTELLNEPS